MLQSFIYSFFVHIANISIPNLFTWSYPCVDGKPWSLRTTARKGKPIPANQIISTHLIVDLPFVNDSGDWVLTSHIGKANIVFVGDLNTLGLSMDAEPIPAQFAFFFHIFWTSPLYTRAWIKHCLCNKVDNCTCWSVEKRNVIVEIVRICIFHLDDRTFSNYTQACSSRRYSSNVTA